MGNQQGNQTDNTTRSKQTAVDPFEAQRKRLSEGYKVWIAKKQASEILTKDDFQNKLFVFNLTYGGLLYDFMGGIPEGGGASCTGVTAAKYIEAGLALLHPPTSTAIDTYFNIFSGSKKCITKQDVSQMIEVCHQVTWQCTGLAMANSPVDERVKGAVLSSLFGQSEEIPQSDFVQWCGRHCLSMFDCIHQITCAVLLGDKTVCKQTAGEGAEAKSPDSEFEQHVAAGTGLLTSTTLWLLTASLPGSYIPAVEGATASAAATAVLPLVQVCSQAGWHLLYDSNEQGLSVNRFQHHVFEYKGPTLTFISFEGHVYCVAADNEWREGRQKFGGSDSCLIQIHPKYSVMQAGADMLYVNFSDRTAPRGLTIGKDARTSFLGIDEGFSKVNHYGMATDLYRLQVWGCAGLLTREAQQRQKEWDKGQAQKSKDRKFKIDDWKDNPDRQILEMGGVTTEHAER